MLKNGFMKVSCVTPTLEVGNPSFNVKEIVRLANESKASITVFPELSITGYSCADLFYQRLLINDTYMAIDYLLKNNKNENLVIVGAPLIFEGSLVNTAIVVKKNDIIGVVPKRTLPNTNEFNEKRWFKSALNFTHNEIIINGKAYPFGNILFNDNKHQIHFGIELCEDMWSTITPGNILSINGANMIINLSASNSILGKHEIRRNAVLDNSRRNCGAYIYVSAGASESTSETVFSGHNIVAVNGELLNESTEITLDSKVMYSDIDVDMINYVRRKQTNLHDSLEISSNIIEVNFEVAEVDNY